MKKKRKYRGRIITIDDVPEYMYKLRPNCKDILRAYIMKLKDKVRYSKENPKKIKEWSDATYKKHSKKVNKQTLEYYYANKEYLDKKHKEWYAKNRDERLAYGKAYRDSHKEENKAYRKIHYAKPETKAKKKAYRLIWESIPFNNIRHKIQTNVNTCLRRYANKGYEYKGNKYKDIDFNAISKHLINLADNMKIKYEEIKKNYHIDHIIPVNCYTLDEIHNAYNPANLRWLLASENVSRQDKIKDEEWDIIKELPSSIYPSSWKGIVNEKSKN